MTRFDFSSSSLSLSRPAVSWQIVPPILDELPNVFGCLDATDYHDRITAAGDMVIYRGGFPAIDGRQPLF
jgi:hypothetical protein